jgi:hypothetical protein
MPWQTKNPIRMIGGNPSSGGPNTGEMLTVRGGALKATLQSGGLANPILGTSPYFTPPAGSGNNYFLFSGAGRLNSVLTHQQILSGVGGFLYDAGGPVASGTSVSGQSLIGVIPPTYAGGVVSGVVPIAYNPEPYRPDMPFYTGLCLSLPSGNPGVTVSWTPDTTPANPAQ